MNPSHYILSLGEMSYAKVATWGIAMCVVYFFTYFDDGTSLVAQISETNAQLEKAQKNLAETKEAMADAERFEKLITQNKEEFKKVLEYLPSDIGATDLTQIVFKLSARTNASPSTQPLGLPENKVFYEMIRLSFELKGTFSQVVAFLSSISKEQKLLTFEGIKIQMNEGADPENPSVMLSGIVVGYRYLHLPTECEVAAQ
jgi:Tfp pilus assembly protein PilO